MTSGRSGLPRLLMLHGWTQNAESFAFRAAPFARRFKGIAELTWATAPHAIPAADTHGVTARDDPRAWFVRDPTTPTGYSGWTESRRLISRLWLEHGGFDAVVGFSQGAVALHRLLEEVEGIAAADVADADDDAAVLAPLRAAPPACAVLVCGFPAPRPDGVAVTVGHLLRTPSLHSVADNDTVVPGARQRELVARFSDAEVLETDKGHAMPQRAGDMQRVVAFVVRHVTAARETGAAAAPAPSTVE